MSSIQIKTQTSVNHEGLTQVGVLSYKIGQYLGDIYAANLTTNNPDTCYLELNGVKKTAAYFNAPNEENTIKIYDKYKVTKLPSFDSKSVFNFEDLKYFVELVELDLTNSTRNIYIRGNIESFARMTKLEQLKLNYAGSNRAVGSIDTLLDSMFSNGRTSGSLYIYCGEGTREITYGGSSVPNGFSKYFDFDENGWTERT